VIKQHYQTLFAYSRHTTERLLDKAALLDAADYHAHPGFGHGSIHALFFHMLDTLRAWRLGLITGQRQPRLQPESIESLPTLRAALAEENEAWQALVAGLSDEEIDGALALPPAGSQRASVIDWRTLQHLLFHNMQHHTELAHLLTLKGQSPGDLDFIFYQG
jgi:uncharacterized damage-inducible protein DinB